MTSANTPIPEAMRRFIVDYIDSVPALEALLLMRRSPEREWTLSAFSSELYLEPRRLAPVLAELAARGLCRTRAEGEMRYTALPPTVELARSLDELADLYSHHLVAVTNLIHSKPRPSVRGFSDAFRLRGSE